MTRKARVFLFVLLACFIFSGCSHSGVETDYPAAIMVDGVVYYKTMEELTEEFADSGIIGYTKYAEGFPEENGEANFSRAGVPYARWGEGIAVCVEGIWYYCEAHDAGENAGTSRDDEEVQEAPSTLTVRASGVLPEAGQPVFRDGLVDGDEDEVSVRSGGETIVPYINFLYGEYWLEDGFLSADGPGVSYTLQEIREELPSLHLEERPEINAPPDAEFKYLSVFNESCEQLLSNVPLRSLDELPSGTYYVALVIALRGAYIEQAGDYELTGNEYVFRLIVS